VRDWSRRELGSGRDQGQVQRRARGWQVQGRAQPQLGLEGCEEFAGPLGSCSLLTQPAEGEGGLAQGLQRGKTGSLCEADALMVSCSRPGSSGLHEVAVAWIQALLSLKLMKQELPH
jgi:hypothetical protein